MADCQSSERPAAAYECRYALALFVMREASRDVSRYMPYVMAAMGADEPADDVSVA